MHQGRHLDAYLGSDHVVASVCSAVMFEEHMPFLICLSGVASDVTSSDAQSSPLLSSSVSGDLQSQARDSTHLKRRPLRAHRSTLLPGRGFAGLQQLATSKRLATSSRKAAATLTRATARMTVTGVRIPAPHLVAPVLPGSAEQHRHLLRGTARNLLCSTSTRHSWQVAPKSTCSGPALKTCTLTSTMCFRPLGSPIRMCRGAETLWDRCCTGERTILLLLPAQAWDVPHTQSGPVLQTLRLAHPSAAS